MRPEPAGRVGEGGLPDRAAQIAPPASPRVLLVDDDPAVRASLKFSFEIEGIGVEDYATAEGLVGEAAFGGNACLVIDYRLPGMDGLALLALLRRRGVRAPAIIITSNPSRKLRQAIIGAEAALVEKPLLCDTLAAKIRALVGAGAPA